MNNDHPLSPRSSVLPVPGSRVDGPISVFGLNHTTAPLALRERVFVCEEAIPALSAHLRDAGFGKSVIVSTCNRTEIYFVSTADADQDEKLMGALTQYFGLTRDELESHTYLLRDDHAYRHLFRVASGLDSMIVGEPQILGQVKEAYRTATQTGTTGFYIDKMFHRAFHVAKRIRTETRIGYNPVSISSMAIELARRIFGDLANRKILVVGAGEMCEIALLHFKKEGVGDIFITNRTFRNAQKLADDITGTAIPFSGIDDALSKVDLVLTSTGSPAPIITRQSLIPVMKRRKSRPLFFVDIAVPRDVDSLVNDVENAYLYDIDDLKELAARHLTDRAKEAETARAIIDDEVNAFSRYLKKLDLNPLIGRILSATEQVRAGEMRKTLSKLKGLDEESVKQIDLMTRSIVNKLVHRHLALLKNGDDLDVVDFIKRLFDFEEENTE